MFFLFTLTCISYIKLFESLRIHQAIITGIINGITVLTKSTILLLPLFLVIPFYLKKGTKSVFSLVIVFLASVLVISPWIWRNYKLSGSHFFVHATMGQNLVLGNTLAENWFKRPLSNLESWLDGNEKIKSILKGKTKSFEDPLADKMLINYHIDKIVRNPEFLVFRTIINFLTFWYLSESPIKSIFFLLLQIPLLVILIFSLKRLIYDFDFGWIIIFTIIYYSLLHAFIIGWGRYSVPLIPILVIVAVIWLEKVLTKYYLVNKYLKEKI